MPGQRRDDDPTNRIPAAFPAEEPGGQAHGSTATGPSAEPADRTPTAVPADDPTVADPTIALPGVAPADRTSPLLPAADPARTPDHDHRTGSADADPTLSMHPDQGRTDERTSVLPAGGTLPAAPAMTSADRDATTPAVAPVPAAPAPEPAPPVAIRKQVVAAQKARYGGISWGSAFFGWLSANGMAVLLIAVVSAAGVALGLTEKLDSTAVATGSAGAIGIGGGVTLLVLLFLAYLAGGYVAGRMARFDGARQGVAVWIIGLVVVLLLALAGFLFGAQYNVLSQLNLPRIPVDEGTATKAGLIALGAVLVATLLGAILGGLLGVRYHRKVDRVGYDA